MISENLQHAHKFSILHPLFSKAFDWLNAAKNTNIEPGKYEIEGDKLFAIVQQYETSDATALHMEAHRKYIDIQYMIEGEELVGLAFFDNQKIALPYDATKDFLEVSDPPVCFAPLSAGNFMIFYPTDLHMPCVKVATPATVKKVVIKVMV
ncbi:YhcH/YjgK/YiaL family protein [Panacibacter sp. DH6]|uniref:YhcH/YjgK/YiaL family protein n=1 Tax=Panacibacter microcysteis TaxID=2793269 RepID=A0A931E3M8_9BACT|nr:YhcH/YjgK/YiaL family protein [Panacibacter microcysteis]MBG9377010.1 YhcH/YjgK/YiaL family protein [Panacibacter microcysteis]